MQSQKRIKRLAYISLIVGISYAFIKSVYIFFTEWLLHISRSTITLIAVSLFLVYIELNIPVIFYKVFDQLYGLKILMTLGFFFLITLSCFLLIPILLSKFIYQEKLSYLGIKNPKNKLQAFLLSMMSLIIFVPVMIFIGKQNSLQSYYAMGHHGFNQVFLMQILIAPLYYFCEEFFFRGFLLINLWRRVGWHSFWITDLIFIWSHISKPLLEIALSMPAGLMLAFLAVRTRSIYPCIFVHYILGVTCILTITHVI